MRRVVVEDGVEEQILGYYFNLPLLDQVRLIWSEPESVRSASPIAGRPEVDVSANWGDLLPSVEEAETILDDGARHPRLGEALLAIGSDRPPGGIDRIERYCDSGDPAIRLAAYGAASWHLNDDAERLLLKAVQDPEAPIRNAAKD